MLAAALWFGLTPSARAASAARKSIHEWATCDGKADDTKNVARAFAAAKNSAFTLVVDCPVRLVFGMDFTHTIYIDNGTRIEFENAGKFTIDNVMVPAFVLANTQNVTLTNWNVEYDAGLPINGDVGGYIKDGKFFPAGGRVQPAGGFNNFGITGWLAANRGIHFSRVTALWRGGILPMAVFLLTGDTSNINVSGLHLYVPASAGAGRFIPVAFGLGPNFRSNQSVDEHTPITPQYLAVPHALRFTNIVLDGTYMGWLGSAQDAVFENIQSHRYADLEDADGGRVGGVEKWFAPPHLFYLNYDFKGDPGMANSNLQIRHVVDDGPRVGTARDKGGADTKSGYADSLKIGCLNCLVDDYTSLRPDGFMDVLPSDGLTVSNVKATYDSSFLNDQFPGWRFPSSPYQNVTFENISLTDTAASTMREPVGGAYAAVDGRIVFNNVRVAIKQWGSSGTLLPNITGDHNDVTMNYSIADSGTRILFRQLDSVSMTLRATPATVSAGGSTTLTWTSKNASGCQASGAWSGTLDPSGSRVVSLRSPGESVFTLACAGATAAPTATLSVLAQ